MLADLRHACRTILLMPIVSTVVVVSLAIGIGVNTVVFSWIQARLLDPVPGVKDGRQLLLIEPKTEAGLYAGTSWPEFKDLDLVRLKGIVTLPIIVDGRNLLDEAEVVEAGFSYIPTARPPANL